MIRRAIAAVASGIAIGGVPVMIALAAVGYTTAAIWYAVAALVACVVALTTLPGIGD
jgi:hypothetical protein